jgi:predicted phosphodiesterase
LVERTVVFSDVHFGSPASTLAQPDTVTSLLQEMNTLGGIDEVVLLGDMFEFWTETPDIALEAAKHFLDELSKVGARIVYVIGNHDHHAFISCLESNFLDDVAKGEISPMDYSPESDFDQRFLRGLVDLDYRVVYARYWKEVEGKSFLFTHGHHLDPVQVTVPRIEKTIRHILGWLESSERKPKKVPKFAWDWSQPKDLEKELADSYEAIYRKATMGEFVALENGVWRIVSGVGFIYPGLGYATGRFVPVQNQYSDILKLVGSLGKKVSCFVYGHTHVAGAYGKNGLYAVNSGCWLKEPDPNQWDNLRTRIVEERPNTYITIDDKITLRQLGQPAPIVEPMPLDKLP